VSLVREALAKAEREAAARAAREKGVTGPLADAAQPYRARRRHSRWPWIAALVVAAAGGALVAVVSLRSPAATPVSGARPTEAPEPSVATTPTRIAESEAPATPESSPRPAAVAPAPGTPPPTTTDLQPIVEITAPDRPAATTSPAPPAAAEHAAPASKATARVAPSVEAAPLVAGSFVREFPLGDGRSIKLGGIAWSQAAPLAYLNGKLRGVGESVEGLRIAAIEPERVLLEDGRLRYALTLR